MSGDIQRPSCACALDLCGSRVTAAERFDSPTLYKYHTHISASSDNKVARKTDDQQTVRQTKNACRV